MNRLERITARLQARTPLRELREFEELHDILQATREEAGRWRIAAQAYRLLGRLVLRYNGVNKKDKAVTHASSKGVNLYRVEEDGMVAQVRHAGGAYVGSVEMYGEELARSGRHYNLRDAALCTVFFLVHALAKTDGKELEVD